MEKPQPQPNQGCPFCDILADDRYNQIIRRGARVTAIQKEYRSNNVNFLLISNKHIETARDINTGQLEDAKLWCEFLQAAQKLANGRDFGMKVTCGDGASRGPTVPHLHAHIFSQERPWFPNRSTLPPNPRDRGGRRRR